MADVVKGLTHLAVNQAFVSSSLIIRPRLVINSSSRIAVFIFNKIDFCRIYLFIVVKSLRQCLINTKDLI